MNDPNLHHFKLMMGKAKVEMMCNLEQAYRQHGWRLTYSTAYAKVETKAGGCRSGWYVVAGRRGSGNVQKVGFRTVLAGPFKVRVDATMHALSFREKQCVVHGDCRDCPMLGRACFTATYEPMESNGTEEKR